MEIPIKMDDLGVPPFKETTKCLLKTSEISLRPPALGVAVTTMVKWSFLHIEKKRCLCLCFPGFRERYSNEAAGDKLPQFPFFLLSKK